MSAGLTQLIWSLVSMGLIKNLGRHNREEADGCRESSSCLGDGLGHALAATIGPA
jgi:hypothetical protein